MKSEDLDDLAKNARRQFNLEMRKMFEEAIRRSKIVDRQIALTEEEVVVLKLKGYEKSRVDDYWVLYGEQE